MNAYKFRYKQKFLKKNIGVAGFYFFRVDEKCTHIVNILVFNQFIINWKKNHVQHNSFQTFVLSETFNVLMYSNLHYGR
jgi:hypothetical protein